MESKEEKKPSEHVSLPESVEPATTKMSVLSDRAILEHMLRGSVVIHPFVRDNLSTSSYDVTLGEYYYREIPPESGTILYNPYSEVTAHQMWGTVQQAELYSKWSARTGAHLENIQPEDRIIILSPGENILAHTNEFIGGRKTVTVI